VTPAQLLRAADERLLSAKRSGRNRVRAHRRGGGLIDLPLKRPPPIGMPSPS